MSLRPSGGVRMRQSGRLAPTRALKVSPPWIRLLPDVDRQILDVLCPFGLPVAGSGHAQGRDAVKPEGLGVRLALAQDHAAPAAIQPPQPVGLHARALAPSETIPAFQGDAQPGADLGPVAVEVGYLDRRSTLEVYGGKPQRFEKVDRQTLGGGVVLQRGGGRGSVIHWR